MSRTKRLRIAVLLQCLPLIGAASCITQGLAEPLNTAAVQPSGGLIDLVLAPLAVLGLLLPWTLGAGYLYLRRTGQFLLATAAVPALWVVIFTVSGGTWCLECPPETIEAQEASEALSRTMLWYGLAMAALVGVTLLDIRRHWKRMQTPGRTSRTQHNRLE